MSATKVKAINFQSQLSDFVPGNETVLVVEDSPIVREIIKTMLVKLGYQVVTAENGRFGMAALSLLNESKINLKLILSDIKMPEVDGLLFCEWVKGQPDFKEIPFVFLTSVTDKENIKTAAALKASGYLLKPANIDQIRDKIKSLFPNRKFPALGDQP